ncbi:MAG: acyl-CoA dehydrogenase family protein [Chloroflexi bacterium]|nr:acyl-CoA dehydrogenase family protein [Chloroflexota bacterium]
MDFRFTPEEDRFRAEIQEWLDQNLPKDWIGIDREEQFDAEYWPVAQEMAKKLAAIGWLTLAWPKEYGGQGRSIMEQTIFQEEMMFNGVPGTTMGIGGTQWVGPSIILYGTDEQKKEHLLPIASGDRWWCTGYSESGSGSDLASLQTRAVRQGDEYIVNGQKIWSTAAHVSDWVWLAVRTNPDVPKHRGISLLLVDMKSPGVQARPIVNMAGATSFNEIFFDNVRVPVSNLIGEEDRGWYVIATALDFERSGITYTAYSRKTFHQTLRYVQQVGGSLAKNPLVRHLLAEMATEVEIQRRFTYRVAWLQGQGKVPNMEASIAKVFGSEVQQRVAQAGLRIMGLYGQLDEPSPKAPVQGRILRQYLSSISATIAAGTSEIQRNIIAQRGLGLPRD